MTSQQQAQRATESKILGEASSAKGVTFHQLRDRHDMSSSVSRDNCRRLAAEGRLHAVRMKRGSGIRWFAKKADAKAFQDTQEKDLMRPRGMADLPAAKVDFGKTPAIDTRYQVDPQTFKGGEFSKLGPGRYIEEGV